MVEEPKLESGEYPFIADRYPLHDLVWIEVPTSLEALLRDQARANDVQLVRGVPVELRCMTPQYGDAVFVIFWDLGDQRLHMLAPKVFQTGKA